MSSRFYDMLDLIGKRPGLYIGEKSITLMSGWVNGWTSALGDKGFEGTEPVFSEFNDWVALRLGFYESTSGWRRMLLGKHLGNEEAAFDRFFELFNEFKSRQEQVVLHVNVDQSRRPSDWVDTIDRKVLPWPHRLELIKYTNDKGVFLRFIDEKGVAYRDEYCVDMNRAFSRSERMVAKDEWVR